VREFEIFISHSAKDEDAKAVLTALYRRLSREDFEVLLDRERLAAGSEWRIELFAWLKRCHGAVILFSQDALRSSWVLQEATILNWRRIYEPDFVIIPVYLPPVKPSDLDTDWFAALDFGRIHGIKGRLIDGVDGIVEKVVTQVKQARPNLQAVQQYDKTLTATKELPPEHSDQAAAICYKRVGDQIEFLLIRTSSRKRWLFPKGWTHPGEPTWLTAHLEARQEAGVAGDIDRHTPIRFDFWNTNKQRLDVVAFPLNVVSEFEPDEEFRDPSWCTWEEATKRLQANRTSGRHLDNSSALQKALAEAHRRLTGSSKDA
jgi:8-oxo-dGTP pyrophosphatase MutT (NUDIX family)